MLLYMQMASLLFVASMLACAASAHASGETNCAKLAEICTVALQWRVLQVYSTIPDPMVRRALPKFAKPNG